MHLYHSTDFNGISELRPNLERMREMIQELDEDETEDADHPDISLVNDQIGWSISLYPNGIATLENLNDESDLTPRFIPKVTRAEALKLWVLLSQGELDDLLALNWLSD